MDSHADSALRNGTEALRNSSEAVPPPPSSPSTKPADPVTPKDLLDLWAAVKKNSIMINLLLSHNHLVPSTLKAVKKRQTASAVAAPDTTADVKQEESASNSANGKTTTLVSTAIGRKQKQTESIQQVYNEVRQNSLKLQSHVKSLIPKKKSDGDSQLVTGDSDSNASPAQLQSNGKEEDAVPARKRRRTKEDLSTTPRERRPTMVPKLPQTSVLSPEPNRDILQTIPRHHKVGAPSSPKASQFSDSRLILNNSSSSRSLSSNPLRKERAETPQQQQKSSSATEFEGSRLTLNNTSTSSTKSVVREKPADTKKKSSATQPEGSNESAYAPLTEQQLEDLNTGDSIDLFDRRYKRWFPSTILSRKKDANGVASIKIHYAGWNKRYDRWVKVEQDRIRLRSD